MIKPAEPDFTLVTLQASVEACISNGSDTQRHD